MEKAIVVRLKKGKRTFEVLTHHGKVATWRDGKTDFSEVLFVDRVLDHKGEQYTAEELKEAFGTDDQNTILQEICRHGEVQTNAADRKKAMEEKRKQIMNYLCKYYVNPKTVKT